MKQKPLSVGGGRRVARQAGGRAGGRASGRAHGHTRIHVCFRREILVVVAAEAAPDAVMQIQHACHPIKAEAVKAELLDPVAQV